MKHLITTLTILLTFNGVYASPKKINNFQDFKKYVKQVQEGKDRAEAKTTAALWRLSSYSLYTNNGSSIDIVDSGMYKYSNARGSAFDYEDFEYYDYGVDPEYNLIHADTVYRFSDQGAGFELNERYYSQYDANNRRTLFVDAQGSAPNFTNSEKEEGTYDANGNLTSEVYSSWSGSSWQKYTAYYYTYNGNNLLTIDSGYSFSNNQPDYKATFTYDANGNMIESIAYDRAGNMWVPSYKASLQYDANNREQTGVYQIYDNGNWINIYKDSTGYTGSGTIYTYNLSQFYDSSIKAWFNNVEDVRTLNSNDKPDVVSYRTWDTMSKSWGEKIEGDFTYNTNGDPVKLEYFQYVNGNKPSSPTAIANYYYEHYFNVSVNEIDEKENITIYPNPASSYIRINSAGKKIKQITLLNMVGQKQFSSSPQHDQYHDVDVSTMAKGVYFLQITTEENKVIAKRLVIQ